MEIVIPKGKDSSEELRSFKEEMTRAIKETEVNLGNQQKSKGKERVKSEIKSERDNAIKIIEKELGKKGSLKAENLEKYSNYRDQIDKLSKVQEIRTLRNKIVSFIKSIA